MTGTTWVRIGAISGALAVIFGAFGAHGVAPTQETLNAMPTPQRQATEHRLETFETGARYHMYHALALVGLGVVGMTSGSSQGRKTFQIAGWAFLLGILLFSGPLYGIGVGGPRWLGAIAPIGGVALIVGWFAFAASIPRSDPHGS